MDWLGKRTLFPYGAFFVFLAILTISLVKHGDAKPEEEKTA